MSENYYITLMKESMIIRCSCGDCEHQALITFDNDPEFPLFYLEFHLRTWKNLFRRIWTAIKYVFGYKSRYGEWDEIVIKPEDAKQIALFLNRYQSISNTYSFTISDGGITTFTNIGNGEKVK